jgi:hypothetical protein
MSGVGWSTSGVLEYWSSAFSPLYERLNQLKMALEYYKRALLIYEQRPFDSFERLNMENNIQRLSTALND